MKVVTRFAPSPTGYLHIGSARTALFNYLFARHFGGSFLLRIEDTDFERSTTESCDAIINGLKWLGISHDGEIVYQSKNATRHREIALDLLKKGAAYKCFMSQEEINHLRQEATDSGKSFLLNSPWRDVSEGDHPKNQNFVVRIKAPRISDSIIYDIVQGEVRVANETLDDMVLLRSDGSPTYMLAVVVDDHDMGVSHIIRGDDHLNNAFRQKLIYEAMGWEIPIMGHIPLIHGPDGAKLSKRHGAVGVGSYEDMGYLSEALASYLVRLGWSHGDDEIISIPDAIKWFDGTHIGKGPSRLDFAKMRHINSVYLRNKSTEDLMKIIQKEWQKEKIELDDTTKRNLTRSMDEIKVRSSLCGELSDIAKIYHSKNLPPLSEEAIAIIQSQGHLFISELADFIKEKNWQNKDEISESFKELAKNRGAKLGDIMMVVRCMITGKSAAPSVFEIIDIIGKDVCLERIHHAQKTIS
ncbi:MAG: glutamate--tRNA ligase [Rickettsiaceae bacterium]|nr:glutamate--tRNA ligase [Rickettsiaceae bacterium]